MLLYICGFGIDTPGKIGIRKKIYSQCRVFAKQDAVRLVSCSGGSALFVEDGVVVEKKVALTRAEYYEVLKKWVECNNVDKVYIRHERNCNSFYLGFVKWLKERGTRCVIEIPTYPYDDELKGGRQLLEDKLFREQLHLYCDRVATSVDIEDIWGIRCINYSNGIDIDTYSAPDNTLRNDDELHIAAMASTFIWWNAFERLLEGLHEYRTQGGDRICRLSLIGSGGDERKYREICHKYGLGDIVTFHGALDDKQIDKLLSDADLAISCLGVFRKKMTSVEPLRTATYMAKGLPVVGDYYDPRVPDDYQYYYHVPADDSAISITELIAFLDGIKDKDYKKEIREYAQRYFTWDYTMREVLEYLYS